MKDNEMHVVSAIGVIAVLCASAAPILVFKGSAAPTGPVIQDMTAIEASIAMRKPKQPNQPQKQYRPPDPVVKPTGVSHDEKKAPVEPKKDEPKPKHKDDPPVSTDIDKFKHGNDDDPAGKPVTTVGDFNGSEKGYADISTGDPWLGKLNGDLNFSPPELAKGDSSPVGCIHLTAEGKIVDTKFDVKTDDDLQTAAEAAIDGLKKLRNDHPDPVPDHLMALTTKWLCFKFSVKK